MSMTREEFEQLVSQDTDLKTPLLAAAAAIPPRVLETLDTSTELATIVGLFPVVAYIVKEIGLPWRFDPKRYTELWREKFRPWIEGAVLRTQTSPIRRRVIRQCVTPRAGNLDRPRLSSSLGAIRFAAYAEDPAGRRMT